MTTKTLSDSTVVRGAKRELPRHSRPCISSMVRVSGRELWELSSITSNVVMWIAISVGSHPTCCTPRLVSLSPRAGLLPAASHQGAARASKRTGSMTNVAPHKLLRKTLNEGHVPLHHGLLLKVTNNFLPRCFPHALPIWWRQEGQ
jgi:hypothetical protein